MKTWMWILAIVALILLLWRVRESFEATPSIKAPPYDAAEKERIYNMVRNRSATPPYTILGYQDMLMGRAKSMNPNEQDERKLREFAGGLVSPAIESFFTTVYKPATTPITEANIDAFMLTRTSDLKDVEKHILTTYFIGQSGVGRTGVDSYTARLAAEGLAQNFDFSRQSTTAPMTGGTAGSGTAGSGTAGSGTAGSGTTGSGTTGSGTTGDDISRTSGTTTGGTTGTTQGPNSGGGGARRKQVFGPIFTGVGDGGVVPNDSSKTNQYPELLGGDGGRASTRIDGTGIVTPSGGGITLPPSSSLGSDENSKYFPFSRQPGDMELIPDPYRVSQQFSASNYSFKTEPVPFLTDFSAFQR